MTQRTVTSESGREVQEIELARLSSRLSGDDEEKKTVKACSTGQMDVN